MDLRGEIDESGGLKRSERGMKSGWGLRLWRRTRGRDVWRVRSDLEGRKGGLGGYGWVLRGGGNMKLRFLSDRLQ